MNDKVLVLEFVARRLQAELVAMDAELKSLRESRSAEGKSSAGDKHETGRAMMDQAIAQMELQRAKTAKMASDVQQLSSASRDEVGAGALVSTGAGRFFLSVSLGKMEVPGVGPVFLVSPVAPLAQAMLGKRAGAVVHFNGNALEIADVL